MDPVFTEVMEIDVAIVETYKEKKRKMDGMVQTIDCLRTMESTLRSRWVDLSAFLANLDIPHEDIQRFGALVEQKLECKLRQISNVLNPLETERAQLAGHIADMHATLTAISNEFSKTATACSLCYDRPIDACISRCGHAFCNACISRVTSCPKCRIQFEPRSVIRIFM